MTEKEDIDDSKEENAEIEGVEEDVEDTSEMPDKALAKQDDCEEDIDIEELPPQIKRRLLAIQRASHFEGPLPPPELLKQYNEVIPKCAETIIEQFVAQGNHRRELEKMVIGGDVKRSNWGLVAGFTLGLVGLLGSFYVISIGYSLEGLATFLTALGVLVGSFIFVTRKRDKERKEKDESVPEEIDN